MATGLSPLGGIGKALGSRTAIGQAQGMLGEAREAGLFNPTGSPRIRALMRRRRLQDYRNARRRAAVGSRLYDLDPSRASAASNMADIAGTEGLSRSLGDADYEELTSNRDFYRSLFGQQLGHEQALQREREAAKAASKGGVGQFLGSAAGMLLPGVGSFLGGGGRAASSGGGSNLRYQDPRYNRPID